VLRRLYRKLGPRYPRVALALSFQPLYLVYLGSFAFLTLYVDVSWEEFCVLALAIVVLQAAYNAYFVRAFRRELEPVLAWLRGEPADPAAAWRAAARLPVEYLRMILRYGLAPIGLAVWTALAVWQLELSPAAFVIIFIGACMSSLYGAALVYFLTERVLRPVLEDIAQGLADARFESPALSLGWRLLATLPALNIVTGVTVAGLSTTSRAELADLGLDVLVAVVVAFTVSLGLAALLSGSILGPIRSLQQATERVGRGDLAARVPVVSTDEVGRLSESFNRMASGLQERQRLREAFGAFVDPEVGERVLQEGTDLAGEEVEVSVLFLDVRGFTRLAEQASPREVVGQLNELYEHVVPIVLEHGGHANKFIGDGMLALFGAPERLPDHADRAVRAALDIARLMRERYRGELQIGLGVNSGRVLVGTLGGGGRLDFTAIGDAVNTAARVEAATRETGDQVLITDATHQLLSRGQNGWQQREGVSLKGKSESVVLYAPTSEEQAT
jgi:adenylate cyclase